MMMASFCLSECGGLKVTRPAERLSSCLPTKFFYYQNGFAQSIWLDAGATTVTAAPSSLECRDALKELDEPGSSHVCGEL